MSIPALNRAVTAANLPLEKLASSTKVGDREKIAEVSRQFEAVLLRQILAQSQKPLFQSSLAGSSSSNAIYQDMVTQQLADRISHGGSFGFAKVLEKQLASQNIKKDSVAQPQLKPYGTTPALKEFHSQPLARAAERLSGQSTVRTHHVQGQPGKRI